MMVALMAHWTVVGLVVSMVAQMAYQWAVKTVDYLAAALVVMLE